jgi:adenylate cyclase
MTQANRQFTMDGESRQLTVLFADIRGFTTLSENLHPNDLKRLLNHFFNRMTEIIFKSGGTIDKYVGDMIMAFWGAPLEDPGHQRHAIEAATNMINALTTLNPELRELQLPTVSIGIGINTGLMNVGDMGSTHRRAYTVIGDSVNLASRLEGLTKYYGAAIVVGEDTVQAVPEYIWRKLDRVKVKGKNHAVTVYEPIGQVTQVTAEKREELDQYHRALDHYYARRWAEANEALRELARNQPGITIYALYLSRIASLECDDLPTDWDGTYERRTK